MLSTAARPFHRKENIFFRLIDKNKNNNCVCSALHFFSFALSLESKSILNDTHLSLPINTLFQIKKYLGKLSFLAHIKFNMNALIKIIS